MCIAAEGRYSIQCRYECIPAWSMQLERQAESSCVIGGLSASPPYDLVQCATRLGFFLLRMVRGICLKTTGIRRSD